MRGIGRQHHPAPLRIHTYRLQAFCVAAYLQQADSRRKLCITVVEYHSIFVNIANQRHNIVNRSEEHTSELQSLMRISYAVFCLKKKKLQKLTTKINTQLYTLQTTTYN